MRKFLSLCFFVCCVLLGNKLSAAHKLLADLNLSQGKWEMVCVSLHNYHPIALQRELGTFVIRDPGVLKKIQQKWEGNTFYDDNCDYHYAIKFYQDRQLKKTLRLNLHCNYISEGVFSYTFDIAWFLANKPFHIPLPWSYVTYREMSTLRSHLKDVQEASDTYMYQDIKPYDYDGYFVCGIDNLNWRANRDSVMQVMQKRLTAVTGKNDFYIVPYIFYMNDDWKISFRFNVFCNEDFAKKFAAKNKNITASWRSHFEFQDDKKIVLVVVGVDDKRYRKLTQ